MKKRLFSLLMAAVTALSLSVSVYAQAVAEYESIHTTYRVGGYGYDTWAILYKDHDGRFRSSAWVEVKNGTVPARHVGLRAGLYNTAGQVFAETGMWYNSSADFLFFTNTSARSASGMVYGQGYIELFDGADFVPYNTTRTPYVNVSRAAQESDPMEALAETLSEEGQYPVNAQGQTYGSELLAEEVGSSPDLISAINADGLSGYIAKEDIIPDIQTVEDAAAYSQQQEERTDWNIPLYDQEGTVIGTFQLSHTEEVPPEVQATEERLREDYTRMNAAVIPAVGDNDVSGYIKRADIAPPIHTLEEARVYMEAQSKRTDWTIPLYDASDNVIGTFTLSHETTVPPAVQATANRIREKAVQVAK